MRPQPGLDRRELFAPRLCLPPLRRLDAPLDGCQQRRLPRGQPSSMWLRFRLCLRLCLRLSFSFGADKSALWVARHVLEICFDFWSTTVAEQS